MSKEAALAAVTATIGPTETTPTATPSATTGTVPESLAKKEAEIVRQRMELKKQQEEWAPRQKKAEEILKIGEEFETLRKTDPFAAFRRIGFSETEIFNFLAASETKEPTAEEKAIAAATAAADAKIKAFEDAQIAKATQEQEKGTLKLFRHLSPRFPA